MNAAQQLGQVPFLTHVSPETLQSLWERGTVKHCKKGTVLISAEDRVDALYIQLSGKSFVYTLMHTGQRKIIYILGPGSLLNQNTTEYGISAAYIETLEPSDILSIPLSELYALMQKDFDLVRAILTAQERKIWRLTHQQKNTISSLYMERKLAAKLWKLARDFGVRTEKGLEIDFDMPVTFLADLLGIPRETASRLRNTLAQQGLILVEGKRITIPDPERIVAFYKNK